MTVRLEAGLAGPADDASIRELLRSTPVPGAVTLSYEQEPSFFVGQATLGPSAQAIVGRDPRSGAVKALACRSIRQRFVNGEARPVGYLSHLRISSDEQGRWLLGRGFRFLRELHEDGACAGYITTIVEGNATAVGVLVDRPRKHQPTYREVCRVRTLALVVRPPRPRSRTRPADISVAAGTEDALPEIAALLQRHAERKQFAAQWTAEDFSAGSTTTPGLSAEDFVLVYKKGRLVAAGGLWDQSAYKQSVVRGYSKGLRRLRPAVNIAASLLGAQGLPAVGERLRSAYAAPVAVADDDADAYGVLLEHLLGKAHERGLGFLIVGHVGSDPLLEVSRRFAHIAYNSRLYTVSWDDAFHEQLDGRPVAVDVACL